jgi:hypothetical protein
MPYLKINHDDSKPTFEEVELPGDSRAWLDTCYELIGCVCVQVAPTCIRGVVLVIDEEAKLYDGWQNRINKVASILYGSDWDPIVGDALLARVDGEELEPLTDQQIELVRRHFSAP